MKMIKKTAVYSLISASLLLAGAQLPAHADVGGDLTPDKPLVDQDLVNEIQQKIVELSNKSEKDVQASGMSVPDFKPAYDKLQQALTDALTGYVQALSQIDDSLSTELAHLKALEAQAQGDSSGLFKQLVDDEFKRVFPTLNDQLNATYSAALATLYSLPSIEKGQVTIGSWSYDRDIRVLRYIPVEWKMNDNDTYSLRVQTGEIEPDGDGDGHSLFTRSDFDTHFFGNALTDEGRKESTDFLHQNFPYKNLFIGCTTGACVLKLKESLAQAMALADALNVGISFANVPSQTVIKKADIAVDAPVALAMLKAVETILAAPVANQTTTVAANIARALLTPVGGVVKLAAVPVMVFEKAVNETRAVLGSTYTQYKLEIKPLGSYPIDQIQSALNTNASYYASTLPAVVFSN